eukprot:TRINITY_DN14942_c0_g1_i1.p1 TRINITY_DN14942_c0_g1~~TRINITY_DN14942_c0_g1_i1.p1  ORF type:complete len:109 (-),score=26.57 TRINITY_DN14942_c0_g1_i1:18-344(-)
MLSLLFVGVLIILVGFCAFRPSKTSSIIDQLLQGIGLMMLISIGVGFVISGALTEMRWNFLWKFLSGNVDQVTRITPSDALRVLCDKFKGDMTGSEFEELCLPFVQQQ